MTSVSGNKDRSGRNRKHTMTDCSPTKSASFSPDSWYRKACEESRAGFRPVPEGARSVPGSSGAPSPGSGTSSPGSFSSSPGTVSPGIGTSSPGSLGGSPGFGTGSPASGSGSSPGSERGTWCDNCTGRLVELKRQAAKLLLPGPYSSKDPSLSLLLHDKLQIPSSPRKAWNEHESRCDVCFTHLSQLKQEAVRLVLTCDVSPGSPPSLASLVGTRSLIQGSTPTHLPGSYHSVTPSSSSNGAVLASSVSSTCSATTTTSVSNVSISSPHHTKHGTKPNTLGVERKTGSPAHTHPENTWSPAHSSRSNGVTLFPYQMSDSNKECMNEAVLNRCNVDRLVPPPAPPSTAPSTGPSAAASFFARAAQKLNLSSKKKKQKPTPTALLAPPLFPTNFSGILQVTPPPAPPCLLRAVSKVRDNPGLGKVKVMLRVCAVSHAESSSFLKVDSRKKQVSIMDPASNSTSQQNSNQKRGASTQAPPKMFTFDSAFSHDASQAEVCAGTVAEVIQSVVNGADGCVFCFGHAKLGKTYTMIGKDDSMQNLGIIPCAISWLFKIITERKEKTGARFSVRVSAVEVWGKDENLKDLLSDVATGSLQDGQSPGVYLCEDPICGMQLQNQSELRAPTAEKAAFFLDAAIAARYSSRAECDEDEHRNSHMLFTLHIYQYRMEKTGKGGMSGGRSRLHLIDLGSCVKELNKPRESATPSQCLSLLALGNVILALVNGSKHIPYKDSKLTMLLRESLGNMNCRTTMIAHISSSPGHFSETLSTLQIASRVLRMKKKKTKVSMQYTSSSSGGESSCEEGRMRRPTQLRNIHSRNVGDSEIPLLHISSDPDDYSSSEQSCDTVIYVGPNGSALSDRELTDNEGPPEFVPIIPSIHKTKSDQGKLAQPSQLGDSLIQPPQTVQSIQTLHPQTLPPVLEETAESSKQEKDCLKCNTFAELQERLGCIDGSEEVNKFPFEEVPAGRLKKIESLQSHPTTSSPKRISNDQQLEEIREVVEEAEIAQSIIESLTKSTINCVLSTSRSVTGGSGVGQLTSLQRANSSSLHNSRESISGGSSSDGKPRPMGSPRLGIASLTKTSEYKPPSSPSQRCKVYTQKGVMPSTPPQSSQNLYKDSGKSSTESLLQAEFRTSPVGMGPHLLKRSSSSNSLGSVDTLCDDVPQLPLDNKNSTTVTLQQCVEPQVEDELVFTLVEELTVNGIMEDGRPTSIISFNSDCSVQALASGSRPISIISSMSEGLESYSNVASTTTATISETNIAKFLPLGKVDGDAIMSRWSSNISWLTEMSTGSGDEQYCHSVVMQQCFGQGEGLAEVQLLEINEEGENEVLTEQNKENGNVFCAAETSTKMSPTMGKTTVTISNAQSLCTLNSFSPNKTNITAQPCVAVKPIIPDPPTKHLSVKEPRSPPVPLSREIVFDDPWMKRNSSKPEEPVCEVQLEKGTSDSIKSKSLFDRNSSSSCEAAGSPDSFRRVVDGCEMVLNASESITPVFSANILRTGSLPRAWHRLNKQDDLDDSSYRYTSGEYKTLGVTTSTPCSPRATLERRGSSGRQGFFMRPKGIPPLPPVRKSSLDQRNRASPQHNSTSNQGPNLHLSFLGSTPEDLGVNSKQTGQHFESSRLFSAKLELLANRTNSLGRSHGAHYDCHSLERGESLMLVGSKAAVVRDSTMPRVGRSFTRNSVSSPTNGPNCNSNVTQSPKSSQSKISAVTKLLMASPKSRSLSTSSTKTLSFSTKSLPQSVNRSSSLPPNGKNPNPNSWSTQSLSRNKGSGLASKLPLRAVNGRISELLQGSAGQAAHARGACNTEEKGGPVQGEERPVVHTLPSPYSKITAPRRPHRCSSGHASDNSSVLSGELPPAMGKTALFYHSGGSSGYESMIRDSEATGSASSAQDSMSDNSSSVSGRRSLKNSKKRNNTGTQRRRLIPNLTLDPTSPVRKPILSPGVRWVDGPHRPPQRGVAEPFEIKVYEIDDVERLQRRRSAGSKGVVYFSAKLKILEHRQQRISEIRTKYDWLKKELEQTKQHLMLEPEKWTSEFDVEPVFEVDSLEYLEALEFVTQRLENRVNFCKAHLMMVTCFDITCRRR
ncbi:kinesin-like protein KIF26B isoform X1 [Ictalurus punctatus]|uniref:Kinesin-like protein KIF26B isoform X1 n=1 Tax=Ictalurus punctatus TaxID=7998 RepID=A0A9F7RAE4_ICTPU|nr:kinesin-like protein KIF26B isoform X1 [Ictalurus punctatus]